MKIVTQDGDVLDALVWRHYGLLSGAVESVLAANPHLSQHGPVLPAGLNIELPMVTPPASQGLKLWD
ncbi:phage tail protein [Veronia nyctiphanis]|uniref:Phage tail protein n=1 Tax=Veronia nyctiphanis TaxID=1278244 RepID=A0A4Q0YIT0_9GAMM|nr:tail protein X [Veronia nyctiphanis]RXJ70606.1 phage tail protein [Veronia nyctiphanis]